MTIDGEFDDAARAKAIEAIAAVVGVDAQYVTIVGVVTTSRRRRLATTTVKVTFQVDVAKRRSATIATTVEEAREELAQALASAPAVQAALRDAGLASATVAADAEETDAPTPAADDATGAAEEDEGTSGTTVAAVAGGLVVLTMGALFFEKKLKKKQLQRDAALLVAKNDTARRATVAADDFAHLALAGTIRASRRTRRGGSQSMASRFVVGALAEEDAAFKAREAHHARELENARASVMAKKKNRRRRGSIVDVGPPSKGPKKTRCRNGKAEGKKGGRSRERSKKKSRGKRKRRSSSSGAGRGAGSEADRDKRRERRRSKLRSRKKSGTRSRGGSKKKGRRRSSGKLKRKKTMMPEAKRAKEAADDFCRQAGGQSMFASLSRAPSISRRRRTQHALGPELSAASNATGAADEFQALAASVGAADDFARLARSPSIARRNRAPPPPPSPSKKKGKRRRKSSAAGRGAGTEADRAKRRERRRSKQKSRKKSSKKKRRRKSKSKAEAATRLSIIQEAQKKSGRRGSVSLGGGLSAEGLRESMRRNMERQLHEAKSELDPDKYCDAHADEDLSAQALKNIRQRRASVDQGVGPAMAGARPPAPDPEDDVSDEEEGAAFDI